VCSGAAAGAPPSGGVTPSSPPVPSDPELRFFAARRLHTQIEVWPTAGRGMSSSATTGAVRPSSLWWRRLPLAPPPFPLPCAGGKQMLLPSLYWRRWDAEEMKNTGLCLPNLHYLIGVSLIRKSPRHVPHLPSKSDFGPSSAKPGI
jgi:hypothetical protein